METAEDKGELASPKFASAKDAAPPLRTRKGKASGVKSAEDQGTSAAQTTVTGLSP